MPSAEWRICSAHCLLTAYELDLGCSRLETPRYLKLRQLLQHIIDVVPQPAHKSQSVARSVKRAMGASHYASGWARNVAGQMSDLVRLRSSRRGLHAPGQTRFVSGNVREKVNENLLKRDSLSVLRCPPHPAWAHAPDPRFGTPHKSTRCRPRTPRACVWGGRRRSRTSLLPFHALLLLTKSAKAG